MFNYLSKVENTFFDLWNSSHFSNRITQNPTWPNDIKNYAQYLATPFSSDTLNHANFRVFFDNFILDLELFLSPIFAFYFPFISNEEFLSVIIKGITSQLWTPFLIAIGAIDILLLATTLSLGLVTRSIATLAYMLDYAINSEDSVNLKRAALKFTDIIDSTVPLKTNEDIENHNKYSSDMMGID